MELVYNASWHSYEEWGEIRIYDDGDENFHVQWGGQTVYSSPDDPEWGELHEISFANVLELIDEWNQIERENEEYWENNG